MRIVFPSLRRVATYGAIAIVAAATVIGCSDDSTDTTDDSAAVVESEQTTTAGTTTAAAQADGVAAAPADAATTAEITDAYVAFFDGTTPPATRADLLENGQTFLPVLEGMASDPQALATTATVEGVTTIGDDNAEVAWTLLMNAAPVLPDQSGEAVRADGRWKVSAVTFCTLMAIQGSGGTVPGC
ncbi:lipase chaperone [Rhodococcus rhodochrous]|uniref:lipase chaperone n=1 Tax=Rhodococcus rhodochrous TaxID=1829 RepID=UPI0002D375FB|nr:lipase chaperone [Rhodococcus rhodochrous]